MYSNHQPIIQRYARAHPDNLTRVMQMVILTAHAPFERIVRDVAAANGDNPSSVLFGWKLNAFNQIWHDREKHYQILEFLAETPRYDCETFEAWDMRRARAMIEYIADTYGFGLIKGGFVLQLAYGLAGCLDTHNLALYGYRPREFDNYSQLKSAKGRQTRIARYIGAVYAHGGPAKLWDKWCNHVASLPGRPFKNGHHVSRLHLDALGLSEIQA